MQEIAPLELQTRLQTTNPVILDVRETWEFEHCRLPGAVNIPLDTLPARLTELNPHEPLVAVCHHGMRSHYAAEFLRHNGFAEVLNLTGGIDRWAREVEPTMPRY